MNQMSRGSIIAWAVFLIAVGGVWWLASGGLGGASQGQVPQEGPARSEDAGGEATVRRDDLAEPEGDDGGGRTSGPTESEQAANAGEPDDGRQSGQEASTSPAPEPADRPSDPLGMRAEAEKAAREGGAEAGVAGGQRAAAARYVLYAYGYSGDEPGEYSYNLSPYIEPTSFYASEGGEQVQEHATSLSEGAVRSAAELLGLRKLSDEAGGRQRWLLRLAIGEQFAGGSEGVTGNVSHYEQEVTLVRVEDDWRVAGATELRPIEPPADSG